MEVLRLALRPGLRQQRSDQKPARKGELERQGFGKRVGVRGAGDRGKEVDRHGTFT